MAPVKELLNLVVNCEIWGRLGCDAASIGYAPRIRKPVIHRVRHAVVTKFLSSDKSEGGPSAGGRRRRARSTSQARARPFPQLRIDGNSGGGAHRFCGRRFGATAIPTAAGHLRTRSTCRISLNGTAECS